MPATKTEVTEITDFIARELRIENTGITIFIPVKITLITHKIGEICFQSRVTVERLYQTFMTKEGAHAAADLWKKADEKGVES